MTDAPVTAVRLERCAKTFRNGTRALDPVDLAIAGGETVVLLGPSGCGKTTLLRILAGLEQPDPGGAVFFNDEDVTRLPVERRAVGMVFQSYALFPNMSVRGNVEYGLKVRGDASAQRRRRADEMLDMMHIGALAERRVDQLSGGQRQRVALARAIAPAPRVLLLDEPLTALDAALRDRLRVEIDDLLRGLGTTAVYVTHDQSEAMALGDRIVVMSEGRIAQIGAPREVYRTPANEFVAGFIGTVNRLPAHLSGGKVTAGALCSPAPDDADLPDGEVELLFRPEDARLAVAGEPAFTGRVSAAFYLGGRTRLILEETGPNPITVEVMLDEDPAIGSSFSFAVDPGRILLMPARGKEEGF